MTIRSIFVCLAVLPLLVSCVRQSDVDSLGARMTRNEQQMQQLSSQVGNVEQVLPGQAEMWAQMQAMRNEMNMVRGQLDEMNAGGAGGGQVQRLNAQVARLESAVRQMAAELGLTVEALDQPLDPLTPEAAGAEGMDGAAGGITTAGGESAATGAAPTAGTPATATPTPPATPPATATPTPNVTPTDTATHLYDSGMNAFASRNYRNAVKAFTDFTKAFPDHKLVSNAHFWRGESYYQMKDYAGAALAYQDVIQKFSGSGKFQSAMLKQGMALYYNGAKDAAKARLDELVKKYPKSPEAGRAKKFMQDNK